ncbi:sensor histidine kinase [Azospirillum soli]|uniref:sensor histidine kinase n=1 Tax=Azospirillum soli TaxID=1304799 RepID=UPI001AE6D4E2|nr:GAF domain-containing protein [Azospirillum soli]MBP2314138.1 two-component sensor histidine kinase [Azospirillum soli]
MIGAEDGRDQRASRSERLLLAEKTALEMAVGGALLSDVLDLLARTGAEQLDARAAIFVVDEAEGCLRLGAAAGLPDVYRHVTERFEIGPHSPSCGLAAHTGQRVIVGDVTKDALWTPYLALAKELGIGACWSTPIRSFAGTVLGVFTVYHRQPCEPEPRDLEAIDLLAHTVAILIERDRTERERRESEALLSSVLDHLPVGVAVYGTDGLVRRTNDIMRRYTSNVLPSADDRAVPRWRATGPDGLPVERHNFAGARALRGETVVPGIDFQYRQDDGTDVWTRVSAAPLRDEAGRITGAVAVVTDIDTEKRAEQELQVALAEARQNELVAREMSHRIMNSFQLLHGVLSMQTQGISDPEARRVVEQAFGRVQAMAVVHRRLFEATRHDLATLDVAGYLRGVAEGIAAAFIDGTRCTLMVEVPDSILMETGRASSLGLIATELTLNALKHAFGDGGEGRLTIRFDRVEQGCRLTITDNGPGLPKDLDLAASSGMGMKLVRGLVGQLDGTMTVEDANPGSRFVITFPA